MAWLCVVCSCACVQGCCFMPCSAPPLVTLMLDAVQHAEPCRPGRSRGAECGLLGSRPARVRRAGHTGMFCSLRALASSRRRISLPACLYQCSGPSMQPTLNPRGDVVVSESISVRRQLLVPYGSLVKPCVYLYRNHLHLHLRGDIVVAVSPRNPKMLVCKRLVALVMTWFMLPWSASLNPSDQSGEEVLVAGSEDGEPRRILVNMCGCVLSPMWFNVSLPDSTRPCLD
jgi:hypothetical protein